MKKEGLASALLPTWKVFIKGYKKPFRVAAMDKNNAKQVAHQMMKNNTVKITKIIKESTDYSELFNESGILYKAGVKKYGKEGMKKIQQAAGKRKSHAEIGKIKDKYEKGKKNEAKLTEVRPGKIFVDKKNLKKAINILDKNRGKIKNVSIVSGMKDSKTGYVELPLKVYDKAIEILMKNKINPRG